MNTDALIESLRKKFTGTEDFASLTKEELEQRMMDLYGFFVLGIRLGDTSLTGSCLEILKAYMEKYPDYDGFVVYDISQAAGYVPFCTVLEDIRKGKEVSDENFRSSFNPFIISLEELKGLLSAEKAVKLIFEGALDFVMAVTVRYVPRHADEKEKMLMGFLNSWIPRFVSFLSENTDDVVNSEYDDLSALGMLTCMLDALMSDSILDEAFDSFFTFVRKCVSEYCLRPEEGIWIEKPLESAIAVNNEHAFSSLMKEAMLTGTEKELEFRLYPSESLSILSSIFSLGQLLPGTRSGRRAFDYLLTVDEPSAEIIRMTLHPSYFRYDNLTPVMRAATNRNFPPENLHLLLNPDEDVEKIRKSLFVPLSHAILNGRRETVEELKRLGGDILLTDEDGDTVLHYACGSGEASMDKIMNALPLGDELLLFMKNNDGKTPLDYLKNRKEMQDGE